MGDRRIMPDEPKDLPEGFVIEEDLPEGFNIEEPLIASDPGVNRPNPMPPKSKSGPSGTDDFDWYESAGLGAAQGLTYGFADEIYGAAKSFVSDKTYEQARDEARTKMSLAQAEDPGATAIGNLVGAVASPVNKVMAPLSGAKAIAGAASLGGLAGTGYSNADTTTGMAKDAATGAILSAGIQAGVNAVTAAGRAIKEPLLQRGIKKSQLKEAGPHAELLAHGYTAKQVQGLSPKQAQSELDKISKFGGLYSPAARITAAHQQKQAAQQTLDTILDSVDDGPLQFGSLDLVDLANNTANKLGNVKVTQGGRLIGREIKKLERLLSDGTLGARDLQSLRSEVGERAYKASLDGKNGMARALNIFKDELDHQLDKMVGGTLGDDAVQALKESRQQAGAAKGVIESSKRLVGKAAKAAGAGGSTGEFNPLQVGGYALGKAVDAASEPVLYMYKVAERMQKNNPAVYNSLVNASKRGKTSLLATHAILMKTNQKYREAMNKEMGK